MGTSASPAIDVSSSDPRDRLVQHLEQRVIPGLDGIRGIAALAVVMFHGISERFPGGEAVQMFFVLSGFLITWLLLAEEQQKGTVELRAFYGRRAFRLFPAIIALLAWELVVNRPRVSHHSIVAVACYVANYYSAVGGQLGPLIHTWSLAVEEHFYLVWPAILVYTTNRARLLKWVVAAAVISAVDHVVTAKLLTPVYAFNATDSNASALLCGCAITLLIRSSQKRIPAALFRPLLTPLALIAIVGVAQMPKQAQYIWGVFVVPFQAIILLQAVTYTWPILENRMARFLGRISYGIYVWQFVAIWLARYMHLGKAPLSWVAIPAAAVLLAAVSHYAIERPAQSAGRRLLTHWSSLPRIHGARVA